MKGTIHDVDAQRSRWRRYRAEQQLSLDAGERFGRGGLARQMDELDARLLLLPADPETDAVPLDGETLGWLAEDRPTSYGGRMPHWGHERAATSTALVLSTRYRDDAGWDRYLALHRHGGVEFASSSLAYEVRGRRAFALRRLVGLTWIAVALQVEAARRWAVVPPCELTIALRNTAGATLGDFAEGWREPSLGLREVATCIDEHVLIRVEFDDFPDPEANAMEIGDRLEQAFGTTHRRHVANRGEFEGRFDPRFAW
jgi:hypothetical protein